MTDAPLIVRPPPWLQVERAIGTLVVGLATIGLAIFAPDGLMPFAVGFAGAVTVLALVCLLRCRAVAQDSGLSVRNAWKSHHWGWDELQELGVGPARILLTSFPFGYDAIVAIPKEGRAVPIQALAHRFQPNPRQAEMVALMQQLGGPRGLGSTRTSGRQ